MAIKMSNILIGFVLFGLMTSLYLEIYQGFQEGYGFTENGKVTIDGEQKSIMEALNDLTLISGLEDFTTGLHNIASPTSSVAERGYGLIAASSGILKISTGIILAPIQLLRTILSFYINIPIVIVRAIDVIFTILVGYILVRVYTGTDV